MNAIFLLAFRNLAYRKSRTLLTTLGIAIGIATAAAVFILDYNTVLTLYMREVNKYGNPDLEVTPASPGDAAFREMGTMLRNRPYVQRVTPVFFHPSMLALPDHPASIEVAGLEPEARAWFRGYYVGSGRDIPDGGGRVILLTRRLGRRLGVTIGDTVRFAGRPEAPFRVIGLMPAWLLGQRNNGDFGIIPFREGRRTFRDRPITPFYWVRTRGGVSVETVRADLGSRATVTLPPHLRAGQEGDKKVMRDGVRISGILTLALGLYLVFTALSMSLAERIREIGLMQAIGTTDRQIMAVFIVEAAVMAAAGVLIGLAGGIVLAWGLMKFGFSSLGTGTFLWTFRVPRHRVLPILVLGGGAAIGGALYPMLKASRIPVVEALKQRGLRLEIVLSRRLYGLSIAAFTLLVPAGYVAGASVLGIPWRAGFPLVLGAVLLFSLFLGILFLGPSVLGALIRVVAWPFTRVMRREGLLAERTLSRSTARIASSLGTLAVVFAALIGLKHMTMSLKAQSRGWVHAALDRRIFVSSRLLSPPEYARLARIPGVQAVVPMSYTLDAPFLIRGLPIDRLKYGTPARDTERRTRFRTTPSLMLSTRLAHAMGLAPGDTLTLQTLGGPVRFPVLAVTDEYGYFIDERAYGVMALHQMTRLFRVDTSAARQFTLFVGKDADPGRIKDELYGRFGDTLGFTSIITGAEKRYWTLTGVDRDFFIFEIILMLTAALAGIGVANALLINALERRREFGLLQALGVTPAQLVRLVIAEGALIGLVGGILGGILGLPLSWIIIEGLKLVSRLELTFTVSPLWIGVSVGAAVAVSTLAGLYPAWKIVRAPVTESLQYE